MKTKRQLEELKNIRMEEYVYDLPEARIAKFPLQKREDSKLLIYRDGQINESRFVCVEEFLHSNQVLIFNDTKVIHARLFFQKSTGAMIEIFCLEPYQPSDYVCNFASEQSCEWICMIGNLKKWKEGILSCRFVVDEQSYHLQAEKRESKNGEVIVCFSWDGEFSFSEILEHCGRIPIPPYLNRESQDTDELRYQTVYSKKEGSVAAPTAGLHFTEDLLNRLRKKGVQTDVVTLHVGAGTFRPVKAECIGGHDMHTEHLIVSRQLVERLRHKVSEVIAVGTTSVRTLESLYWMGVKRLVGKDDFYMLTQWEVYTLPSHFSLQQSMQALLEWFDLKEETILKASTTIVIVPGYHFRVIDAMFTNFHQPQSTLLLLVGAAVGSDWRKIYDYALKQNFRFLSYGDSNFLTLKK